MTWQLSNHSGNLATMLFLINKKRVTGIVERVWTLSLEYCYFCKVIKTPKVSILNFFQDLGYSVSFMHTIYMCIYVYVSSTLPNNQAEESVDIKLDYPIFSSVMWQTGSFSPLKCLIIIRFDGFFFLNIWKKCLFSFLLFFNFSFIHVCIHCLGHTSSLAPTTSLFPQPLLLPGRTCSALFSNFVEEKA
jgi:hypothetical protein